MQYSESNDILQEKMYRRRSMTLTGPLVYNVNSNRRSGELEVEIGDEVLARVRLKYSCFLCYEPPARHSIVTDCL